MSEQEEKVEQKEKSAGKKIFKKRTRNLSIYKANQKNTGSAAQFSISSSRDCMFLECAKQIAPMDSERPYDWDNKVCVKLGLPDISKFLAYLQEHKPSYPLKLYHETPGGGNKSIEFKYQEYKERPGYFMSVAAQKGKGEELTKLSIPVGMDEAALLLVALRRGVEIILGW
jgi:hypothetical protein